MRFKVNVLVNLGIWSIGGDKPVDRSSQEYFPINSIIPGVNSGGSPNCLTYFWMTQIVLNVWVLE